MTRPRLFVSDLDGTLLDADAQLSQRTRDGLARLLAAGVAVTFATARSPYSVRAILGDLPLALPVVALHGAVVTQLGSTRHDVVRATDAAAARCVLEIAREHGTTLFVSTYDGERDRVNYERCTNGGGRWFVEDRVRAGDPRLRHVPDLDAVLDDAVLCLTVMDRREPAESIAAQVRERTGGALALHVYENAYSPGWTWVTAHSAHAGKDVALRDVVARHGLGEHEIVAYGDTGSDLPLFAAAHRAVAVANAEAAVRAAAHEVVASHREDGVVRHMLRTSGLDG